jgi:hypothetical protein
MDRKIKRIVQGIEITGVAVMGTKKTLKITTTSFQIR